MTCQPATISNDLETLPRLPGWVTSGRTETLETVTFQSGAALTVLDQLIVRPEARMAICWPSGAMEGGFVRKGHGRSAIWLEWSTRAR